MAREKAVQLDLGRWASQIGIGLSSLQISQLDTFLDTLTLWNRKMALVSQRNPSEVAIKHLADSLFAARSCAPTEAVADLGSGAGLPGIPMAIARPNARVCLMESRAKKASFMLEAIRLAGISNAQVFHGRIEAASALTEHSGRYSMVISRAFAGLDAFLGLARPLLRPGGRAVAMKGPRYKAELDSNRRPHGEFHLARITPYELPGGSKRALLVFRFT